MLKFLFNIDFSFNDICYTSVVNTLSIIATWSTRVDRSPINLSYGECTGNIIRCLFQQIFKKIAHFVSLSILLPQLQWKVFHLVEFNKHAMSV